MKTGEVERSEKGPRIPRRQRRGKSVQSAFVLFVIFCSKSDPLPAEPSLRPLRSFVQISTTEAREARQDCSVPWCLCVSSLFSKAGFPATHQSHVVFKSRRAHLHRTGSSARFSKNRRRDLGSKNDPGGVLEYSPGSNDPGLLIFHLPSAPDGVQEHLLSLTPLLFVLSFHPLDGAWLTRLRRRSPTPSRSFLQRRVHTSRSAFLSEAGVKISFFLSGLSL